MNIRVLTKEESIELWEKEKEERSQWTTEQIIEDAKFGLSLPGTKYILTNQYEAFYKWLETNEAREQWNILPRTQHLARHYLENKTK
jgi:hypothetical protein